MNLHPNKIPAQPGDIIKLYWPSCYAELLSIDRTTSNGSDYYVIKFQKICSSTYKFYKKIIINSKTIIYLPYKVERAAFIDLFDRIHRLTSMIKG